MKAPPYRSSTIFSSDKNLGKIYRTKEICPICGKKNIDVKYEFMGGEDCSSTTTNTKSWSANITDLSPNSRFFYQVEWLSGRMLVDKKNNKIQVCERCYKLEKLKE